MAKIVADGRVAGMTTLLARHGKVVEFRSYGKADLASGKSMPLDAIFRIASMTKPITGVAMMILFEEGKWRLDDPVSRFVPEFKSLRVVQSVNSDGTMVLEDVKHAPTMRELMSHTAGFGYGLEAGNPVDKLYREHKVLSSNSLQEMIERTASIPLKFQPGTNWAYSSAVDIQGYIVEKLSGQKFSDFLEQHILKPLKMNDTGFYVDSSKVDRLATLYGYDPDQRKLTELKPAPGWNLPDPTKPPAMESGGGGLISTTMDYARFSQMILNKGELDGVRILSPASVELMGTNVISDNALLSSDGVGVVHFNHAVGFGLDFQVTKDARAAGTLQGNGTLRWGGAFGTWFWIDPLNDVMFVGMIQRANGGGEDLPGLANTLTYQALTHPEK